MRNIYEVIINMNICIDGLSVSHLRGTGYYSYAYGILSSLFEIYPQPKYELLWDNDSAISNWQKYKNVSYLNLGINRKDNDYILVEKHLKNSKTDLYYSPNNGLSIPQKKVCKYIMTVHDLSSVSCSNLVDKKYYNKFVTLFPDAVKKADCIIAVSNFIKSELIKFYKIPEKKIEVIYPASSQIFKPLNDLITAREVLKNRYHVEDSFILYAGSIHPRKNLDILIKSFKMLSSDIQDIKLVIVGNHKAKRKEYYLALINLIHELQLQDKVIFTGTVEYIDMPLFYNCAECAVNLSSYEGFPITTIEASACNCPVVCFRSPCFEEINLPNAVFLDELHVRLLKNTLTNILIVNQNRASDKKQFLDKSIAYTWENAANKLIHVIESR